jgi:hypothetical protein
MPKDSVKSGKKPKTVVEKVIASIVDLDQVRTCVDLSLCSHPSPPVCRLSSHTEISHPLLDLLSVSQDGGSSRQSILKHARDKYGVAAPSAIAKALKAGVAAGTLSQTKQTFAVVGHTPTAAPVGEQLEVIDVKVGDGDTAEVGAECTMKYVGTLEDGTRFDAAPSFKFTLGAGEGASMPGPQPKKNACRSCVSVLRRRP